MPVGVFGRGKTRIQSTPPQVKCSDMQMYSLNLITCGSIGCHRVGAEQNIDPARQCPWEIHSLEL